jgi:DNA-binding MarR family transcriptional regulator
MSTERLYPLLKHAQLQLTDLIGPALAPYGIDGRELAVLNAIADNASLSQQEVARGLGIDRTTMVAMVDALERKGLVKRNPHPADRRKNTVELTAAGRDVRPRATRASLDAERRFLAPLGEADAERLKEALSTLVAAATAQRPVGD